MKRIIAFFAAVFTAMSLNAQTITVDSVSHTSSSAIVHLHFTNVNDTCFIRVNFGDSTAVNELWTIGYMITPGTTSLDVSLNNLTPNTQYSCAGFIYYPVMIMSSVFVFTTDACALSVSVSSVILNSCSEQLTATGGFSSYQWKRNGAIISGATSSVYVASNDGSYTVSVGDATCTGISSAVIVDVTEVTVTACADKTICEGGSTTISATGPAGMSYVWSDGSTGASVLVSPNISTTYTVTGSLNGCENTDAVWVKVNQLPNVSVTVSQDTACVDANINFIFTATNGSSLSGSNALNGNSMDPSVAGVGQHTITATMDVNGCTNTNDVTVHVLAPFTVTNAGSVGGSLLLNGSFPDPVEIEFGGNIYTTNIQNSTMALFQNVPSMEVGDLLIVQTVGGEGCFVMTTYSSVEELLLGETAKEKDTRIFDIQGRIVNVKNKSELTPGIYIQGGRKFIMIERNF